MPRLYQVFRNNTNAEGEIVTRNYNSDLMLAALQEDVPEIDLVTAVYDFDSAAILSSNEKKLKAEGNMVSEDFF